MQMEKSLSKNKQGYTFDVLTIFNCILAIALMQKIKYI